ncbi:MAG: ABC-type transport auxiliary lipoprotein family protein [Lamprobacter sp.]|uniref:ABC-type transport auxiliary lipoprotein family protein n=1 Tax=Lamprobacter sp. TaxID=3100796 RepID=UPI002B25E383|nr:ABC-type transport auxiliary lipoprotein family protein [Lamprobacter sp.]MEA3640216.1 ABC-type transport auxiliary lipoprotein family protein [Lamprobacter sp.]
MVRALNGILGGRFYTGSLCLLLLLSGCGGSGPPVREQFYSLQPDISVTPSTQTVPGTLLVTPLGSRGFLGGTQIVFRTAEEPLQVQRYHDFLWETLPGQALTEALIAALRTANLFTYTVSIADRARAGFMLNGELTRLEHWPTADPPAVSLTFNLTLITGNTRATQFSRDYSGTEPTTANRPEAMVRAFNRLSGRLLSEAVRDLQRQAPQLARDAAGRN